MKKIVLVDDSGTARMFIRRCLEIAGCQGAEFAEAGNGKEALTLLKAGAADFDFVVSDLNMPVLDGKGLLKWIKASPKLHAIPVVIISSSSNPALEKELKELGAYAVLSKPISPPQLIAELGGLFVNLEEKNDG